MQVIKRLKLKNKLFFLFLLITFGLLSIGVLGVMHIESMKKNADGLYFGSLVPITELDTILQNYNSTLTRAIYKAHRLEASHDETILIIQNSLKEIQKKWKNYESHFKHEEELEYIEYVSLEMKSINQYFLQIIQVAKEGKNLHNLNVNILEKKVSFISSVIQKLINYEVNVATHERSRFLENYKLSLKQLGLVLTLVIIAVLVISYYVFTSIQQDNTKLQTLTKRLKRANKKLENVSYTDVLTGLHNRRYFNYIYENELKRAKRAKRYITFMMLDLDYFKQYNDTYGHLEGDKALQCVAKVLQEKLKRPSDYVFRLGGEEFGILLSDTDESMSAQLARKICDGVREEELLHENSLVSQYLTISIGIVSCIADEALDDKVLLSRSDEMLYKAKESGRDRYVITSNVSAAKAIVVEEELIA